MSKPESRLEVVRTAAIAPRMRRIVLGGPGFADYLPHDIAATDKYVKIAFGESLRTYTVRWVDPVAKELAIDFVTHDVGLAGPWALRAQPGDELVLRGPGGAYRPDPHADHQLFVGDESALPAIAAALEVLTSGDRATAFIEVDGPDHEIELECEAALDLRWLHRGDAEPGSTQLLFDEVTAWEVPAGRLQAFVHGESALLKTVRPYLLDGRVARADISVSAYWRCGETEEGFRSWKKTQDDAIIRPERLP